MKSVEHHQWGGVWIEEPWFWPQSIYEGRQSEASPTLGNRNKPPVAACPLGLTLGRFDVTWDNNSKTGAIRWADSSERYKGSDNGQIMQVMNWEEFKLWALEQMGVWAQRQKTKGSTGRCLVDVWRK